MNNHLIVTADKETAEILKDRKYPLLKEEQGVFTFINNQPNAHYEDLSKKIVFSNKMTF